MTNANELDDLNEQSHRLFKEWRGLDNGLNEMERTLRGAQKRYNELRSIVDGNDKEYGTSEYNWWNGITEGGYDVNSGTKVSPYDLETGVMPIGSIEIYSELENLNKTINDLEENIDYQKKSMDEIDQKSREVNDKIKQIKNGNDEPNPASSTNDSTENTRNAGNPCEKCQEKGVKCLCHVEFINTQTNKTYRWRAGNGELSEDAIILGLSKKEEPFTINYEILASQCTNDPSNNRCTKPYYVEYSGGNFIPSTLKNLDEQKKSITLPFDNKCLFFLNNGNYPYILHSEEESGKIVYTVKSADRPVIITRTEDENNENIRTTEATYTRKNESAGTEVSTNLLGLTSSFLGRLFNFVFKSKLDGLPITAYHLAVQDCGATQMPSPNYSQTEKASLSILKDYDAAKAEIYVLPEYKMDYELIIELDDPNFKTSINNITDSIKNQRNQQLEEAAPEQEKLANQYTADDRNKGNDIARDSVEYGQARAQQVIKGRIDSTKSQFARLVTAIREHLKISLKISESYNGIKGDSYSIVLEGLDKTQLKNLFGKPPPPLDLVIDAIINILDILDNFKKITSIEPLKNEAVGALKEIPDKDIITHHLISPKISLQGSSILKNQGGDYIVEREGEISFSPLFGGELTINLALLLIKKIPQLYLCYESARGLCALLNSTGEVNARIATDLEKTKEEIAAQEDANIAFELVIYCKLTLSAKVSTTAKLFDSRLHERPALNFDSFDGDFDLLFEAGAYYYYKVFIFWGAYAQSESGGVNIKVRSGLKVGCKEIEIGTGDNKHLENVFFTYFKGVEVVWSSHIARSISVNKATKKPGDDQNNNQDTITETNTTISNVYDSNKKTTPTVPQSQQEVPYYDQESAEKYLKAQQEKYQDLRTKQTKFQEEQYKKLTANHKHYYHDGLYGTIQIEAEKEFGANKFKESISITEDHLDLYKDNKDDLKNLAKINQQLKQTQDPTVFHSLSRERYALMERMNDVSEADLPLPVDGFYFENPILEQQMRDRNKKIIDDLSQKAAANGNSNANKKLRKEKETMDKSDVTGRSRLFDSALWGANNLPISDREQLKKDLDEETDKQNQEANEAKQEHL